MLIIACPCALLLAVSFTNGHILRILSRHRLHLRNAAAIERLAGIDHTVFDKTGTLTNKAISTVNYIGLPLTPGQTAAVSSLAAQSSHPLSQSITAHYGNNNRLPVSGFKSVTSQGISGWVQEHFIEMSSAGFVGAPEHLTADGSTVFVAIDG